MDCKLMVLLLACVVGPMTCETVDKAVGGPIEPTSTKGPTSPPTTPPPITTSASTTTSKPTTAPTPPPQPPTSPTTTTTTTTTTAKPNSTTTISPKPAPTSPSTTPTPHPSSTTEKPHPSDRKFDAFSFIGGFALAIGLVAIGFLAWKLYISRRDNVYHTL